MPVDVTDEAQVAAAYDEAVLTYGGVDIVVNAGVALAKPVEETDLADWERLFSILSTGYFLVARQAARVMKRQAIGGSIVFVTSKNAMVASSGAAAYNAAKASGCTWPAPWLKSSDPPASGQLRRARCGAGRFFHLVEQVA